MAPSEQDLANDPDVWMYRGRDLKCLVAERCWDRVRWVIEDYAWHFDGVQRPSPQRTWT
jgi:hypothetical protein